MVLAPASFGSGGQRPWAAPFCPVTFLPSPSVGWGLGVADRRASTEVSGSLGCGGPADRRGGAVPGVGVRKAAGSRVGGPAPSPSHGAPVGLVVRTLVARSVKDRGLPSQRRENGRRFGRARGAGRGARALLRRRPSAPAPPRLAGRRAPSRVVGGERAEEERSRQSERRRERASQARRQAGTPGGRGRR